MHVVHAGKPGSKPASDQQLHPEIGVLISGCQDHQTSADASPPSQPGVSYGAMSNAVVSVIRQHHQTPGAQPLTNRYSMLLGQGHCCCQAQVHVMCA